MNSEIVPPQPVFRLARPKARLFTFLSLAWCFVSALPLWRLFEAGGDDLGLGPLFWLLIVPHPLFVLLAVYFRVTEQPRPTPRITDEQGTIIH